MQKVKRARRPALIIDSELSEEKQVEAYNAFTPGWGRAGFHFYFSFSAGFD
jgi:hypothetical protein